MYIHTYVYMYICIYVFVNVHIFTLTHTYMYVYIYCVYIPIYIYIYYMLIYYMYVYTSIYVYMYMTICKIWIYFQKVGELMGERFQAHVASYQYTHTHQAADAACWRTQSGGPMAIWHCDRRRRLKSSRSGQHRGDSCAQQRQRTEPQQCE